MFTRDSILAILSNPSLFFYAFWNLTSQLDSLRPRPAHPPLQGRLIHLQPRLISPRQALFKGKDAVIRIKVPPPRHARPQKRRVRKHKDEVLGPLAQLLQTAASAPEDGGTGVAVEAACFGGGGFVGPEGVDGEVEGGG
ncbi:hypothetical protein TARUN_10222 [Trichoderma arundinaceum]|uniref:Uncharacterized protein n=1 Tax=Trichoderma arundinaceum TaxID=490622 RepID=A0A395N7D5_TRIAR|nr:hypothetical protein TARUN_10222 [Trichoderma arundinaceum]